MVQQQVHYDLDPPFMGLLDKQIEVRERSELFLDSEEIRDIEPEVEIRGIKDRGEPYGIDPQILHVPETGDEAHKVAHSIPITILEAPYIDTIDNSTLPPLICHLDPLSCDGLDCIMKTHLCTHITEHPRLSGGADL